MREGEEGNSDLKTQEGGGRGVFRGTKGWEKVEGVAGAGGIQFGNTNLSNSPMNTSVFIGGGLCPFSFCCC